MHFLGILLGLGLTGLGGLILLAAPSMNVHDGKGFLGSLLVGGVVLIAGMVLMSVL